MSLVHPFLVTRSVFLCLCCDDNLWQFDHLLVMLKQRPQLFQISIATSWFRYNFVYKRKKCCWCKQGLCLQVLCPHLEYLSLSSVNLQKLWHDLLQVTSSHVQNLKSLIVEGCHRLKYLFLPTTVKCFLQLTDLTIVDCNNVEEVIFRAGLTATEGHRKCYFLNWSYCILKLILPKLATFCHGNYFVFPSLSRLFIEKCPELQSFISNSVIGYGPHFAQKDEGSSSEFDTISLFDEKVIF